MSTALDVAIGIVFLYLLLALMVTTVQELVASVFTLRAKHLYGAIEGMLKGQLTADSAQATLVERLYQHPLLKNLVNRELKIVRGKLPLFGQGLPSYIPSKTFAVALLDVLQGEAATKVTGIDKVLANAKELVGNLREGELKRTLHLLLDDADEVEKDLDRRAALVSARIEAWFNDRMARASGWYKRNAQFWSLIFAAAITLAFNADTLRIGQLLWRNSALRDAVVAKAQTFHDENVGELLSSGLPIGWHGFNPQGSEYLLAIAGWAITALAVSLGAAFWFDVLSRALQLRGSGVRVSSTTGKVEAKSA
jgi:hypothetical protein